jgi:hypothetical protein
MKRPLTAQEAADESGCNIHHLYKLLRTGTIKAERFNRAGMIHRQEVERIKALQGPGGRQPKVKHKK